MSNISINSHDFLGKLSIIKNYLSVLAENNALAEHEKEYIRRAFEANESLITLIKEKTLQTPAQNTA